MIKKIVAIGPESTGKSMLCKQLAKHFNTIYCPEYAREYLNENGVQYNYNDLLKIAQGQLAIEDYCEEEIKSKNSSLNTYHSLLLVDTNMYVMKVWYEFVFKKCEYFILDAIAKRRYDLYLLCNTDLPWIEDSMREYPDEKSRQELYNMYKDILINQQTPWLEINGDYTQRLQKAIKAIEDIV